MKCIGPEKQHKILGRPSARASKGNAEAIIRGGLYILLLRNKENAPERSVALSKLVAEIRSMSLAGIG